MMLLLLAMGIVAQAQTVVSLNGEWQFFYAKDVEQADSFAATGFQREDYKSANFKLTPVPSNWAVLGYEEPVYRGFKDDKASEGFYRLRFKNSRRLQRQTRAAPFRRCVELCRGVAEWQAPWPS